MKKIVVLIICIISLVPISYGQLTSFYVTPNTIDPNYPTTDDSNYVVLNPSVTSNNKLLVFFAGTGAKTKNYLLFPNLAANLGYHCISLSYPNGYPTVAAICGNSADTNCYYDIRQEVCYGTDVSSNVTVDTLNSINIRLIETLNYLDSVYPTQGWGIYLSGGNPVWSKIAVSGHSQGSGHALYLAKTQSCERVIMFAGADDYSDYYSKPANWISFPSLTPSTKFFSLLNLNDDVQPYPKQFSIVQATDMTANGDDSTLIDNKVSPYNNSHCLYTKVVPLHSGIYSSYHGSMVVDFYVPLDSIGKPFFDSAWTYMLTANSTSGVNEIYNNSKQVNIFPNPASEKTTIELPENFNHSKVEVFDCIGEKILSAHYDNISKLSLDVSQLQNGFYFVRISTGNKDVFNKKLIVRK